METKPDQFDIQKEQTIQKIIDALQNKPKGCLSTELCATALNRMLKDRPAICQIQVLPAVENKSPYGI